MPERCKCGSCGAAIIFVKSARTGSYMPLDADPVPDGNVAIIDGAAQVLAGDLLDAMIPQGPRYKSHFATCPNGQQHRKAKDASKTKGKRN